MKFSIIIPTYNCVEKIDKTIASVIGQNTSTSEGYELVIVDGKSTDGTQLRIKEIISGLPEPVKNRIVYVSEADDGIYDAMNKGLKKATGDYVLFLGAGDYLIKRTTINMIARAIELTEKPDVLYGYVHTKIDGISGIMDRKIDFNYTFRFLPVCHQAIVAKRKLFDEKLFDTSYKAVADQDWIMYMVKKRKHFVHVNVPIAYYEEEGFSSMDKQTILKAQHDLYDIHNKYFKLRRVLYLMCKKAKHIATNLMR